MAGLYRMALRPSRSSRKPGAEEVRWSLAALDPTKRTRIGSFDASDGEQVPYRVWRAKTPRALVLLLHGAFDYSGAFDEIGPKLAQQGFTAFAFDQRGFGATATRGRWSGEDRMVDDVTDAARFLRRRDGAALPLFILGESMGGAVAVHAAAKDPTLNAAGLVLLAPGALASLRLRFFYGWLGRLLYFIGGKSELVFERTSGWDLSAAAAIRLLSDPLVMRRVRSEILLGMVDVAYNAIAAARHVSAPVLTMVGGKDDLLRKECIASLHGNLAGEKLWHEVRNGPHLLLHWHSGGRVLREAMGWMSNRVARLPAETIASAPLPDFHPPDFHAVAAS